MKWLGVSWAEYWALPEDVTEVAVGMILREQEAIRNASAGRRGPSSASSVPLASAPPSIVERSIGRDPKTGYEMVEHRKPDGTVVRHRKVEPGEALLWAMVGKRPKSFENK